MYFEATINELKVSSVAKLKYRSTAGKFDNKCSLHNFRPLVIFNANV